MHADHVGVWHPVRGGHDDLDPFLDGRHPGQEDDLLGPAADVMWRWSNAMPVRSSIRLEMAARNAGMPLTAVYLVCPVVMAATAAALT